MQKRTNTFEIVAIFYMFMMQRFRTREQNLHSAQGILSQVKTLQSLVYSLKASGDSYLQFRKSGKADKLSEQLNKMIIDLMDCFPDDGEMPITGMENIRKTRITQMEAQKHAERLCADIPFNRSKGRPTKNSQRKSNTTNNVSNKSDSNTESIASRVHNNHNKR